MKRPLVQAILTGITMMNTGCQSTDTPEATSSTVVATPPQSPPISSKPADRVKSYTWSTAVRGPACLPTLIRLMNWYRADSLHNFQFVRYSINTTKAQGYYLLNQSAANRYLAALQRSGYFSTSYLIAKKNDFQELAREFAQAKQRDGEPEGLTVDHLFPVTSFADMLELQDKFSFTLAKENHTILFDSGEAVQRITFDSDCKISSIKWIRPSPQLD